MRHLRPAVEAFCTAYDRARKTIFLFPGGMASKLKRHVGDRNYLSWLGPRLLLGEARNLRIEEDGSDAAGSYVVPDGPIGFPFYPYTRFSKWCKQQNIHLFIFGWDWRRGVQHSADIFRNTLLPMIEARLGVIDYTLVGHSAGGMVIKVIANQPPPTMQAAITVGTPFYGCGNQPHLFFMGVPVVNKTIRGRDAAKTVAKICASMQGGYEFLFLDEHTYRVNAATFACDPEGYHLTSYPAGTNTFDPARYPAWIRADLLAAGLEGSQKVSLPLDLLTAAKFYCIRGVQTKHNTVVSQTWALPAGFDPDTMPNPIHDRKGPGDGVEAAWGARLLGLPSGNVLTVTGDIQHETLMKEPAVQDHIAAIMRREQ